MEGAIDRNAFSKRAVKSNVSGEVGPNRLRRSSKSVEFDVMLTRIIPCRNAMKLSMI